MKQILTLHPDRYARHPIHGDNRIWAETNCYVDLWVELLHSWGFDPVAALPFTLAMDFEGDQWTFFKFPLADLNTLYGLDVQELAIWRPLTKHLEEQVSLGRPVLVELDSFFLPDTAGTAYRRQHTKTTVAVNAIDVANHLLGYFHNQGYYILEGDDFIDVLQLREPKSPALLPPYAEFVKRRDVSILVGDTLARKSLDLLRHQLTLLPTSNPFTKFKTRFETDISWLTTEPLDTFHLYSFATLRQFGAGYELTATYLQWLQQHTRLDFTEPATLLMGLSTEAKTLQFQLARAVTRKKPMDHSALDSMAIQWETALERIKARVREQ